MVVCLILEVDQPLFFLSVYIDRNNDTAGIDLIRLFLILQFALCFELFHRHQCQIHQADKFVISSFVENLSVSQIFFICFYDWLFVVTLVKFYICQLCGEGCMAAVVRPVSIQYTHLCHRRVTLLFSLKVILNVLKIFECHSQIQRTVQFFKLILRHILEAVKNHNVCRIIKYCYQCFRLCRASLTGIYRVDAVIFDCCKLLIGNVSLNHISSRRTDNRLCIFIQKLHALNSRICSLIKLSRQILY